MPLANPRRQVVVIDEYPGAQAAIEGMLEESWEVFGANSPDQVLEMIARRIGFQAMVADADMMPIGGLELCVAAARLQRPPAMVLVTTVMTPELNAFSLRHQVPVLEKPFRSEALRALLR